VRFIVPSSPGGGTDIYARLLAQSLGETLKQQFVVENRPGASGNIGAAAAAKSAPDGYTFMVTANPALSINPSLYRDLPYDAERDFAPITRGVLAPMVIVASPSLQAKTLAELVALGKNEPGKVTYASAGTGTPLYLGVRMLEEKTGARYTHVPYKGAGAAYGDLISGTVNMMFANMPSMLPQVRGGKVKGLGVTSAERSAAAPDIPAIAETLPGYVATSWYGLGAPAGTPEPIIARLEAAIGEALANPEIQKRWKDDLGLDLPPAGRAGFAEFLTADRKAWEPALKASGVKLD